MDDGEEKQFGMISVKLLKASTVCPDFSVRTMRLKYTNSQNMEGTFKSVCIPRVMIMCSCCWETRHLIVL